MAPAASDLIISHYVGLLPYLCWIVGCASEDYKTICEVDIMQSFLMKFMIELWYVNVKEVYECYFHGITLVLYLIRAVGLWKLIIFLQAMVNRNEFAAARGTSKYCIVNFLKIKSELTIPHFV